MKYEHKMRTHKSISNPDLRTMFARELLALRNSNRNLEIMKIDVSKDFSDGYKLGLDTTYRRMQYYLATGKMPELKLRKVNKNDLTWI